MINLVGKRHWYLLVSLLLLIPGIVALGLFRLKPGIEFTSGSTLSLVFDQPAEQGALRQGLTELGYGEAIIQGTHKLAFLVKIPAVSAEQLDQLRSVLEARFGSANMFLFSRAEGENTILTVAFAQSIEEEKKKEEVQESITGLEHNIVSLDSTPKEAFFVRTKTLGQEPVRDEEGNIVEPSELDKLKEGLQGKLGSFGLFDFYTVSPVIASEIVRFATIGVIVASLLILVYIVWAFRRMPQPIRYGTCAIVALMHDALLVMGVFSFLGKFAAVEIDAMFITGMLTVVGYSINDTVVVFDRIRENMSRVEGQNFATVVNLSLVQTLARSMNTGLTTLVVIFALFFLGGVTLRNFMLVLLIGIAAGTYSSIFVACQLLVVWEKKEWKGLSRRLFFWRRWRQGSKG